jgi:hypothetical protein
MAARTLASTCNNFERIIVGSRRKKTTKVPPAEALSGLVDKVNASRITAALADLFVHPYSDMEEVTVDFRAPETLGEDGEPPTEFQEDQQRILIDPVGVYRFREKCRQAGELLKTPEVRSSFLRYRLYAYLAELAKMPAHYMLIILLLREVASSREITRVVRKRGTVEVIDEPDEQEYMNLLWAFKELEAFYFSSNGLSLRAEYNVHWHESDWIASR